jgi:sugar O-acyltransferase (sialic acid O-acetyltransferase NeuD family)
MALVIFGAGGHSKVVADAAVEAGIEVEGFVDDRVAIDLFGNPVLSTIEAFFTDLRVANNKAQAHDIDYIVAIGDNGRRMHIFEEALELGMHPLTVEHPAAHVSADATVEDGAFVGAEAVINPGAYVGENAIVNTRATVEHDCRVGAHAFVAPHALMCGGSKLGEGALLGANATLGIGLAVGEWTRIGEGAVVKSDIGAYKTAVGIPAKVVE